ERQEAGDERERAEQTQVQPRTDSCSQPVAAVRWIYDVASGGPASEPARARAAAHRLRAHERVLRGLYEEHLQGWDLHQDHATGGGGDPMPVLVLSARSLRPAGDAGRRRLGPFRRPGAAERGGAGHGSPLRVRRRCRPPQVPAHRRADDGREPGTHHCAPAAPALSQPDHSGMPMKAARVPGPTACAAASPPATSTTYREALPTVRGASVCGTAFATTPITERPSSRKIMSRALSVSCIQNVCSSVAGNTKIMPR